MAIVDLLGGVGGFGSWTDVNTPVGWNYYVHVPPLFTRSVDAYEGSYSCQITGHTSPGTYLNWPPDEDAPGPLGQGYEPVTEGFTYTFSFAYKRESGIAGQKLELFMALYTDTVSNSWIAINLDGSTTAGLPDTEWQDLDSDWHYVEIEFEVPRGYPYLRLEFEVTSAAQEWYIDSVKISYNDEQESSLADYQILSEWYIDIAELSYSTKAPIDEGSTDDDDIAEVGTNEVYIGLLGEFQNVGIFKHDNSNPISSQYVTRELDPADQFGIEYRDKWFTVDFIRLFYKDESADTPVTAYLSVDGGASWIGEYRTMGTGDGKSKSADFYFLTQSNCTGQFFKIKLECISSTHNFTWLGFHLYMFPRGEYFEL